MPDPDATWNRPPPQRETSRWRRFSAALPMRTALIAVGVVWLLGCVWSYQEQSQFAASKGFSFPHLLPLVIDGFAVSMAGVSWAASLDARPAVPARLATIIAVGASSASNGVWAYLRANHDMVTVVLGVAVPIAANLAFEVLLAELRRQVQRRRGLPPPVAVPYPRLIRMVLAPWQTFSNWRTLVLEITAMEHTTAPKAVTRPDAVRSATAEVLEARSEATPADEPVTQPNALAPPQQQALSTAAVFTAPATFSTPNGVMHTERHAAGHGTFETDYRQVEQAPTHTAQPHTAQPHTAQPHIALRPHSGPPHSEPAPAAVESPRYQPTASFRRPVQDGSPEYEPPREDNQRQAASAISPPITQSAPRPATAPARPSSASESTAQREPTVDTQLRAAAPAASPASPSPTHTTTRQVAAPGQNGSNGSSPSEASPAPARTNGAGRPIDRRVEQLAQHLSTAEEADSFTGEMVGPLLNIDVAPRTGRRLLGQARDLLERRAEAEANGENDPELSVIGGR